MSATQPAAPATPPPLARADLPRRIESPVAATPGEDSVEQPKPEPEAQKERVEKGEFDAKGNDKTPLTASERKRAAKGAVGHDLRDVEHRVQRSHERDIIKQRVGKRTRAAAAAAHGAQAAVPTATTTTTARTLAMPGALFDDTTVDAPAGDESPSLTGALFGFTVEVVGALVKRKRANAGDEPETRNSKRGRVETNGPSPSRAPERPTASGSTRTGATALTHNVLTATAAPSAARNPAKLKATLSKCPPPGPARTADDKLGAPVDKREQPATRAHKSAEATHSGDAAQSSTSTAPGSSAGRKTALLREAPTVIDLGVAPAAPRVASGSGQMALSRQPAMIFGSSATPASGSSTGTRAMASLREAPTIIDLGTAPAPSSSDAPRGLSRQPAVVFNFGAAAESSSSSSSEARAVQASLFRHAYIPPLWATKAKSDATRRGKRSGRAHHKTKAPAHGERKDEDKGDDGHGAARVCERN